MSSRPPPSAKQRAEEGLGDIPAEYMQRSRYLALLDTARELADNRRISYVGLLMEMLEDGLQKRGIDVPTIDE